MTDLSKGVFKIEGFNLKPGSDTSHLYDRSTEHFISLGSLTVSSQTTKEELLTAYGDKLSSVSGSNLLRFKMLFLIGGEWFGCSFWFNDNEIISHIEMSPCIKYKSEKWDRTGMQEERRQFCDKWLFDRLGEPHKVINGDIEYSYNAHSISCFSNFDVRDGANAGYIVVAYK